MAVKNSLHRGKYIFVKKTRTLTRVKIRSTFNRRPLLGWRYIDLDAVQE